MAQHVASVFDTRRFAQPVSAPSKRASSACYVCHRRKVRCDANSKEPGVPCSNCQSFGTKCEPVPGRRGRKYTKYNLAHLERNQNMSCNTQLLQESTITGLAAPIEPAKRTVNGLPRRDLIALADTAQVPLSTTSDSSRANEVDRTSGSRHSTGIATSENDNVWISPLEKNNAGNGVCQTDSPSLSCGGSPEDGDYHRNKRFVYSGEAFTHSVLPHMIGHRCFPAGQNHSFSVKQAIRPNHSQIYPAAPGPSAAWIEKSLPEDKSRGCGFGQLPQEDAFFLRHMKNVLLFPPRQVTEAYMISFIAYVLPGYPVIDRNQLQRMYNLFVDGVVVSPLLFHSIFYAASQYVDESVFKQAGFESRSEGKGYFYRRAALLYSLDCERDQLLVVQSIIFISTWKFGYGEEKDTRHWIGCAFKLVQDMGMHASVSQSSRMTADERSIWRRTFWTVFTKEHNSSIARGVPFLVNSDDVDVEYLSEADFFETPVTFPDHSPSAERTGSVVDFCVSSPTHVLFALELVRLSLRLDCILKASARYKVDYLESLNTFLETWEQLPKQAPKALPQFMPSIPNTWEYSEIDNMWFSMLQLNYERTVALNSRYLYKALSEAASIPPKAPPLAQVRTSIIRSAAKSINIFEDLLTVDLLKYSHDFMNASIFGAIITYAEEIKLSAAGSQRFKTAVNKYSMGLTILEEMSKYWSASVWSLSLFELLSRDNFTRLKQLPQPPSRWQSPSVPDGEPRIGDQEQAHVESDHGIDYNLDYGTDHFFGLENFLVQEFTPHRDAGVDLHSLMFENTLPTSIHSPPPFPA